MGAIPKPGQERSYSRCFCIAMSLVYFFLFLTAFSAKFCGISPVFEFSDITLAKDAVPKQQLLWWDIQSQTDLCMLPSRKKYTGPVWYSNPAFGGRGTGVAHSCVKNCRKGAYREFDSTLGFPGEGWSEDHPNLKFATWNTRSLTFERFNYCKNLKYDVLAVTELW